MVVFVFVITVVRLAGSTPAWQPSCHLAKIDSAFDGLIDEFSITDGFLEAAELQPLAGIPEPRGFAITAYTLDPGADSLRLTFESDERYLYDVEHSATLEPGDWRPLRTFLGGRPGASTTTIANLPLPDGARAFYRVRCYPPRRP